MGKTKERKQFLLDVFVTGLEGGIGYWSFAEKYHWMDPKTKLDDLDNFFAVVVDCEADPNEEGAFPRSTINAETIEKGIEKIKDPDFKIGEDIKKDILVADIRNDAGEIDADGADCIIQAGLFGEIIFG